MIDFLIKNWYFWLLVLIAAIYPIFKPKIKGWFGEKTVAMYLQKLPLNQYIVLNDVILPTETGTTQIDHIVVSPYGIFVIETKNYKGWILGAEKTAQWTQNIYGKKNSFMNPIRQNFVHVKAVESLLLQVPSLQVIPIVAFSSDCNLKVKTESHVVYFHQILSVILKYMDRVGQNDVVAMAVNLIQGAEIHSATVKKEHVDIVSAKKIAFKSISAGDTCPRCGGMIVKRNGKKGTFLGCSNYPKCRFTKSL